MLFRLGFAFLMLAVATLYFLYPLILFNGTFRFL